LVKLLPNGYLKLLDKTMETSKLRENFEAQLKKINETIVGIENDLERAKEYKAKLVGGMETLDILERGEIPEEMPGITE
jgi:hypothetical protein